MVVGPGEHLCTLLEVWVLRIGMSTLTSQTVLYAEDRGLQVPMSGTSPGFTSKVQGGHPQVRGLQGGPFWGR